MLKEEEANELRQEIITLAEGHPGLWFKVVAFRGRPRDGEKEFVMTAGVEEEK